MSFVNSILFKCFPTFLRHYSVVNHLELCFSILLFLDIKIQWHRNLLTNLVRYCNKAILSQRDTQSPIPNYLYLKKYPQPDKIESQCGDYYSDLRRSERLKN